MAYQRAYWPMNNLKMSQGYGKKSSSHKSSYAIDLCGKDSGAETIFAPFDCKVTKLYQPKDTKKNSPEVWLTSTKKVLCANGYYGYLTMSLTHASEIMKMKLDQTFKQFDFVCKEDKLGGASGNHIHLELSKGKKAGWDSNIIKKYKAYVNVNKVKPEEYLFVRESAKVLKNTYKGKTYKFIRESDLYYTVISDIGLNMRKEPKQKSKKITTVPYKKDVTKFYEKDGWSFCYYYEKMGYMSNNFLKKKN